MRADDAFFGAIIRRAAKTYGLPCRSAFFVSEQADTAAPHLQRIPKSSRIGDPVLIFLTSGRDWSVVASRGVGGEVDDRWCEVPFAEIDGMNGFPEGHEPPHKRELDLLRVEASGRSLQFRSSAGSEFFAFWNICRKLAKVSKRAA